MLGPYTPKLRKTKRALRDLGGTWVHKGTINHPLPSKPTLEAIPKAGVPGTFVFGEGVVSGRAQQGLQVFANNLLKL